MTAVKTLQPSVHCVVIETVVMAMRHVTCGMLVVGVLTTLAMVESSASERAGAGDDMETAAAVAALARALETYRRPAADRLDADWTAAKKREAALDADYGWGGGRFGKRRMADRLGIAGRFGRSVDITSRSSSASSSQTQDV